MNPNPEDGQDNETALGTKRIAYDTDPAVHPNADVGVLLVHGIGNHRESVTLRSFGQPLLNWLTDWLARGEKKPRSTVAIREARFNDANAPAYALTEITVAKDDMPAEPSRESWLFCEAWWGAVVQPPASIQLLIWMWTRGPLLIYWHFYIRQGATLKKDKPSDAVFAVIALLLAGFCQIVIAVALVLSLIPIGPWRRKVVQAVRILTLTLGDSYVLEEQIQRAALVEQVRHALDWLCRRSRQTVVIAHSQGGAIAHEVLQQCIPENLAMFVTVGSGLEKLHFLRQVGRERRGLIAAWLLFPLLVAGAAVLLNGVASGLHPQQVFGTIILVAAFGVSVVLLGCLDDYKKHLAKAFLSLKLPRLSPDRWIDFYASDDIVPMNKGSLLSDDLLVRERVFNERSYLRDHVSYFTNGNDFVPALWRYLVLMSRFRLFSEEDASRLGRFARVHKYYAHLISFSRLALFVSIAAGAYALHGALLGFGHSVITGTEGTPAAEWLKPIRALAGLIASVVQRVWKPDAVTPDRLADAMFGAAILLGGVVLWWITFHAAWVARCNAFARKACGGGDVIKDPMNKLLSGSAWLTFLAFGCLPLIVFLVLISNPEALTLTRLRDAIAMAAAVIVGLVALFYAGAAPLIIKKMWHDPDQPRWQRLLSPVIVLFLMLLLTILFWWLWPAEVDISTRRLAFPILLATSGVATQVYTTVVLRKVLGLVLCVVLVLLPLVGSIGLYSLHIAITNVAPLYLGLAVLVLCAGLGVQARLIARSAPGPTASRS